MAYIKFTNKLPRKGKILNLHRLIAHSSSDPELDDGIVARYGLWMRWAPNLSMTNYKQNIYRTTPWTLSEARIIKPSLTSYLDDKGDVMRLSDLTLSARNIKYDKHGKQAIRRWWYVARKWNTRLHSKSEISRNQ